MSGGCGSVGVTCNEKGCRYYSLGAISGGIRPFSDNSVKVLLARRDTVTFSTDRVETLALGHGVLGGRKDGVDVRVEEDLLVLRRGHEAVPVGKILERIVDHDCQLSLLTRVGIVAHRAVAVVVVAATAKRDNVSLNARPLSTGSGALTPW